MRILVVAKDFPEPGSANAGIFVLRQAQALTRLGCETLVVRVVPRAPALTPKWRAYRSIPRWDVVGGIRVRTIRAFVAPRMIGFEYLPLQVEGELRAIAADFGPDAVHAHFLIPSGQIAVRLGIPSVVTAHGSDAYDWALRRRGLRLAAAESVRRATRVAAVSDFIRRHVRSLVEREIDVIYNGADERVFFPRDRALARRELGIAGERFVVAFAGNPPRPKGAFDLIAAMGRLAALRPLLLCAGPKEDAAVVRAAREHGVEARLYGVVDQNELARLLGAADVFSLPSYREGLPASVCEAMLAGRPVVAAAVGGIPEILAHGTRGYLVPPGDVGALQAALATCARDPHAAERMGIAAHRYAIEHLTWNVNAARYLELYRRVLDEAA